LRQADEQVLASLLAWKGLLHIWQVRIFLVAICFAWFLLVVFVTE
jgi:hypothetical protein